MPEAVESPDQRPAENPSEVGQAQVQGLEQAITGLRFDVDYVRSNDTDCYDQLQKGSHRLLAGHVAAAGSVSLIAIDSAFFMNDVSPTYVKVAGYIVAGTAAVLTGISYLSYGSRLDNYSGTKKEALAVNGYTVESLIEKNSDKPASVVAAVIPTYDAVDAGLPTAAAKIFNLLADEGKADKLLVPASMAAQLHADMTTIKPLREHLERMKDYWIEAPDEIAELSYVMVEIEPDEAKRQLKRSLVLLAERFPELIEHQELPETVEATRDMAGRLHGLVHRNGELAVDMESYRLRDHSGVPRRHRQHLYMTPALPDDEYTPAVWIHRPENPHGLLPERRTVHELAPTDEMHVHAPHGVLTSSDVIPALGITLKQLRRHEAQLLGRLIDVETTSVEIGTANRLLKLEKYEFDNPSWRRRLQRAVGIGAAAVALAAGAVVGIGKLEQAWDGPGSLGSGSSGSSGTSGGSGGSSGSDSAESEYLQDMSSETSGVGRASVGGPGAGNSDPGWRVQGYGMDASGYYAQDKFYHFGEDMAWHSEPVYEGNWGMMSRVPESEPHITVTRFSNGSHGLYLPIKDGTKINALRVFTPEGNWTSPSVRVEDDGTVFLQPYEEDAGRLVKIEFDLVPTNERDTATRSLSIEGLDEAVAQAADSSAELARDAVHTRSTFTYDNTARLDEVMDDAGSPRELLDAVGRAQLVNCNVVASYLAVRHELRDSDDLLAYTTGYRNDGRGFLTVGHAWLTAGRKARQHIIDGTPGLGGRTLEEAGLGTPDDKAMEDAWQRWERRFANPPQWPDIPWDKIPVAAIGMLAASNVVRRLKFPLHEIRHWRASSGMTGLQADAIIAQAAWDSVPVTEVPADPKPINVNSLPFSVAIKAAADPRIIAAGLTGRQRRSLKRHARLLMDYHAGL
jgi:hypothetical protein